MICCSAEGIPEFRAIVKAAKGARKLIGIKYMGLSCLHDVLRLIQNFPSWRFRKCGPWIYVTYLYLLSPSEDLEQLVSLKELQELTQSGVMKDRFNERFTGQPLPFRSCHHPDTRDHGYPSSPCLIIRSTTIRYCRPCILSS